MKEEGKEEIPTIRKASPYTEAVYYVAQKLKTRFFIINRAGDEFLCLVSRPENLPNFSGQTLISGNLAKIRFCFSGHIITPKTGPLWNLNPD